MNKIRKCTEWSPKNKIQSINLNIETLSAYNIINKYSLSRIA